MWRTNLQIEFRKCVRRWLRTLAENIVNRKLQKGRQAMSWAYPHRVRKGIEFQTERRRTNSGVILPIAVAPDCFITITSSACISSSTRSTPR
jgi:hypothetical protein